MTAAASEDYTERRQALNTVLWWYKDVEPAPAWNELLDLAQNTFDYLSATADQPTVLLLSRGLVVDQQSGKPAANQPAGGTMQLRDNQQVGYTIQALDAKGYQVTEANFSASSSDDSVVSVNDSGDQDSGTWLAVAGQPGSATLTFTDGTISATEAIDVVAGDIATISVQAGDPEDQPTTPPDSGGGDGGGTDTGGGDGGTTPPDTGGGDGGTTPPDGGGDGGTDPTDPNAPVVNPLQ